MRRTGRFAMLLTVAIAACSDPTPSGPGKPSPSGYSSGYSYDPNIPFKDEVKSNAQPAVSPAELSFVDKDGKTVDLKQYRGKKNVVLVVTRGYAGSVCRYCTAQTSALANNHDEFAKRNAEVLVVFPGPTDHLNEFQEAVPVPSGRSQLPFPILLDRELKGIDRLGIRDQLARPSTYILDKQGQVRFAYVGASESDRPSLKATLQQLDQINKE